MCVYQIKHVVHDLLSLFACFDHCELIVMSLKEM